MNLSLTSQIIPVAPRAGAWIETCLCASIAITASMSRPARARGLKQKVAGLVDRRRWSRPARARGLKLADHGDDDRRAGRAPRGRVD